MTTRLNGPVFPVSVPSLETRYPVMVFPAATAGGAQLMAASAAAICATVTADGAEINGVAEVVAPAVVEGPVPADVIACTERLYPAPGTRKCMVYERLVAGATVLNGPVLPVSVPSRDTRYPVIARPPVSAGGCQLIVAVFASAAPLTATGAVGRFATHGAIATVAAAAGPVPFAVMAWTENW